MEGQQLDYLLATNRHAAIANTQLNVQIDITRDFFLFPHSVSAVRR